LANQYLYLKISGRKLKDYMSKLEDFQKKLKDHCPKLEDSFTFQTNRVCKNDFVDSHMLYWFTANEENRKQADGMTNSLKIRIVFSQKWRIFGI
jgi:hypothetical protein